MTVRRKADIAKAGRSTLNLLSHWIRRCGRLLCRCLESLVSASIRRTRLARQKYIEIWARTSSKSLHLHVYYCSTIYNFLLQLVIIGANKFSHFPSDSRSRLDSRRLTLPLVILTDKWHLLMYALMLQRLKFITPERKE